MATLSDLDLLELAIVEATTGHADGPDLPTGRMLTVALRQYVADAAVVIRDDRGSVTLYDAAGDVDEAVARVLHDLVDAAGTHQAVRGTTEVAGTAYEYVGARIELPNGTVFGTTICYAVAPCAGITRGGDGAVELLASLAADVLGPLEARRSELDAAHDRTLLAVNDELIDIVYQPLVELGTGRVVGYEAFSRFSRVGAGPTPDRWFADAREVGLGNELEALAVREALKVVDSLPDDVTVSVNVSAAAITSVEVEAALATAPAERVVVELTDDADVEIATLLPAVERLRERGIRFAIDDLGAGYASLQRVLQLRPDMLKLDRGLVAGVNDDAAKASLVTATVVLAARLGTTLVAEGVETVAEAFALRLLGVQLGQGWHYGRPVPANQVANRPSELS